MDIQTIHERYRNIPNTLESSFSNDEPNSSKIIFEGLFYLQSDEKIICEIDGIISFEWFPTTGVRFKGKPTSQSFDTFGTLNTLGVLKLIINDLEFGDAFITNTSLNEEIKIKGVMRQKAIFGDSSIPVEKIKFCIPNFTNFLGMPVKRITNTNISSSKSRIKLCDDQHIILLDKSPYYDKHKEVIEEQGGYFLSLNGEIKMKKGSSIIYKSLNEKFHALSIFLTFINGRRTSPILLQGIENEKTHWTDYSDRYIDIYDYSPSWLPSLHINNSSLETIWNNFLKLWKNADDQDFINTAIHWYIEANKSSGFIEGSIIMAQTALELLYNWYAVESKKIIVGKDSENINASNKIRLLLSQLNIDYSLAPKKFEELNNLISQPKLNIIDAPDVVVQIRNAIVHSQLEKRKKVSEINSKAKHQALQLCLWYIEMAILKILDYDGVYVNRCSEQQTNSGKTQNLPWHNKP